MNIAHCAPDTISVPPPPQAKMSSEDVQRLSENNQVKTEGLAILDILMQYPEEMQNKIVANVLTLVYDQRQAHYERLVNEGSRMRATITELHTILESAKTDNISY